MRKEWDVIGVFKFIGNISFTWMDDRYIEITLSFMPFNLFEHIKMICL